MRMRFVILIPALMAFVAGVARPQNMQYQSPFLRVELARDQPALVALAVDSLGKSKLSLSALRAPAMAKTTYVVRHVGTALEYRPSGASPGTPPVWTFDFSAHQIHLRSHFAGGNPPPSLVLNFDSYLNHATLLGHINDDGSVRFRHF